MENNKSVMIKGYKPSVLEYIEIALIVICGLLHFVSWAKISINGEQIFSFVPFEVFDSRVVYSVCIICIVSIALKFVGRFSGMTALIVLHLYLVALLAQRTLETNLQVVEELNGWASLAKGIAGAFSSISGSRPDTFIGGHSPSISRFYDVIILFTIILHICVFVSLLISAYRLATMHRKELTHGYFTSVLGYLLMGIIAFLWMCAVDKSPNSVTNEPSDSYVALLSFMTLSTMISMFMYNLVIVILVELLRERTDWKMHWWALIVAGAFFIILLLLFQVRNPFDVPKNLLDSNNLDNLVTWSIPVYGEALLIVGIVTCLLRAIYFGFVEPKARQYNPKPSISESIEEEQLEVMNKPTEEPHLLQAFTNSFDMKHHKGKTWIYYLLGCIAILSVALFFLLSRSESNNKAELSVEQYYSNIKNRYIYNDINNKYNCFIVISKKDLSLNVFEALNNDTVLVATFPACLSKNYGPKQGEGDMKTPECSMEYPFTICQIQDASKWKYDFGDGRGKIRAYGHWFLRLDTGFDGIGIQGSTNNESSVPGRDSSGSIRLRDDDLIFLKENYVFPGMKVIIKHEDEGLFDFEKNCIEKLDIK